MIELPPPTGPYQPGPAGAPGGPAPRRGIGWAVAAAVVLLVVVVALVNGHRNRTGNSADSVPSGLPSSSPQPGQNPGGPNSGGPNSGGPNSGGSGAGLPVVSCPQIRDEQARLAYTCIDNDLRQDGSDIYLGVRIALNHEVEPGWVISEGSGDAEQAAQPPNTTVVGYRHDIVQQPGGTTTTTVATIAAVEQKVQQRAALAVQRAYGDNPTARTLAARQRSFGGVIGYELLTEITINPAYRQAQGLTVRTERLWVVGLPTPGGASIFMMSIPDDRSDLWSRAEAIVGTVHVI